MKNHPFGWFFFNRLKGVIFLTKITTTGKVFTEKQLLEMLDKGARVTVTAVAEKTKQVMKEYTQRNLYNVAKLTSTSAPPGLYYNRSRYLYGSIDRDRTEADGDVWYNDVGFQEYLLEEQAEPPEFRVTKKGELSMIKFGRYTNLYGNSVVDEMLDEGWIEEGTTGGKAPRKGAHIVKDTKEFLDNYFSTNGIQADLQQNYGHGVTITRER